MENKINEDKLLKDIGKYLQSKGWKPLMLSFKGISKRKRKYDYSLIIDFTGIKKNEKNI